MAMLGGNGVKILNFGFVALKAYPASFDVFCVKIGEGVLAVGERGSTQKGSRVTNLMTKLPMRGNETPLYDLDKILQGSSAVRILDIITYANSCDDGLRGLGR